MPGPVAGKTQWRLIRQAPFIRLAETVSTVPSATPGTLLSSIARAPASGRSRHPSDARYGEPLIAVQISSRVTGGRLCCACASVLLGIASVLAAALYNWLLLIGAAVGALAWFVPELVGGGGDITQRTLIDGATLSALSLAFCCALDLAPFHTPRRHRAAFSLGRALLCIVKHLTPIIAWLANLRVKVAADGIDIDHRGCRPAHCRRVRLCRRARRRYLAGAGGRDRAAGRRAIPGAAARAAASAGETASTALSGR